MSLTPRIDRLERNKIIGGGFDFWQRGTSFSNPAAGAYTADRWRINYDGSVTSTISQQAFSLGQTAVPENPKYFLRWNITAASGNTIQRLTHRVEDVTQFSGKTVSVSIWMKAAAPISVTPHLILDFGSGGSPSAEVDLPQTAINLTTSWQEFTITVVLPGQSSYTLGTDPNSSFLQMQFDLPLNSSLTLDIAQAMMVEGDKPATFCRAGRSIAEEESLCQRYYYNLNGVANFYIPSLSAGDPNPRARITHPTTMRAAPNCTGSTTPGTFGATADTIGVTIQASSAGAGQFSHVTAFEADAEL